MIIRIGNAHVTESILVKSCTHRSINPLKLLINIIRKKNREEHRKELDQYQETFSFFREHSDGKVPSMKELKAQKEKSKQIRLSPVSLTDSL